MSFESESLEQELSFAIARIAAEKVIQESEVVTPSDISGAIRSGSSLISLIKEITEIAKKAGNTELIRAIADLNLEVAEGNLKLADLTDQLAELRQENTKLKEENSILKKRVAELENGLTPKLILKDEFYFDAHSNNGPFCTACFDQNQKTIHVKELSSEFRIFGSHQCPVCKAVGGKSHQY